jgi:hypothetical protein
MDNSSGAVIGLVVWAIIMIVNHLFFIPEDPDEEEF